MAKTSAKKAQPNIMPLRDRVLVKPEEKDEQEKTTDTGIIIPATAENKDSQTARGTVVAVGAGKYDEDGERIPPEVAKGDTVLYSDFAADKVTANGEEYALVSEDRILAVVT